MRRSTMRQNRSKLIWLLVVLEEIVIHATVFAAEQNSLSRSVYNETLQNKRLPGHVVQSFMSHSSLSCSHSCLSNSWCTSSNFKEASKQRDKGICELNKHDSGIAKRDNKLIDEPGVTFSKLLKGCWMTGCRNGGSCLFNKEKETFSCSCKPLWSGDKCIDIDIDECNASVPVCDVNAFCQNTPGSFNCTCKTGFTGNGFTCADIDECVSGAHNCVSARAVCSNTVGSYNCTCKPGYHGDGQTYCLPDECLNYQTLSRGDRKVTHGSSPLRCDNALGPAWFRFQGNAGTKMPTSCVPDNRCGTHATGWLNGSHPTAGDGKVTRQVCFSWVSDCCHWSINIQVLNCSSYYLYFINGTPPEHPCHLRYCGTD